MRSKIQISKLTKLLVSLLIFWELDWHFDFLAKLAYNWYRNKGEVLMQFVADLHIHTISSGHAYSTVLEIAQAAAEKELLMIALTDHGPAMPGAPHHYHFSNLVALPGFIYGVRVLKGIEANILDSRGTLDLSERILAKLDIVLAGLHSVCVPSGTAEENTDMMIAAMKNPWVDVIVHPGNPEFIIDDRKVVQAAAEYDVALEINNSSLTVSRSGSLPRCYHLLNLAKEYGCKIVLGTDSHFAFSVGDFTAAEKLISQTGLLPQQLLNTSVTKIEEHLRRRNNRR
ncbi:MAG: ycdX [Firmicutes bacterium]|nr:ycdX [Bacillota bacterium]